jgi:threonine aldolase
VEKRLESAIPETFTEKTKNTGECSENSPDAYFRSMPIDFRSDTVTQPTPEMRLAMAEAPLGDDVFGEDPSVNRLEEYAANLFGMETALFCPSGTMTNQIAIKCHTQPGDEVICDQDSHIYQYEGGGIAFNAGCSVRLLAGDRGRITAEQVAGAVNNAEDVHKALSRLVSLENTSNRGGGSCYDIGEIRRIRAVCDQQGLALHLDGARVFNALMASSVQVESGSSKVETEGNTKHFRNSTSEIQLACHDYGSLFHSISICLSKGLGAPVGSLLLGPRDFIKKARRVRKVFGGGMRQAGMLAAAGLYALENHIDRLTEDHLHARMIADALRKKDFIADILPVETNIIIAEMQPGKTPAWFVERMREKGILLFAFSQTRFRMVTHLDISPTQVEETIDVIESL